MPATKHQTKIDWTHRPGTQGMTWNPVTGCTKVSPGCDNCYAEAITKRFKRQDFGDIQLHEDRLTEPLKRIFQRKTVFVCSMSDLFHPRVPFEFVNKVFGVMSILAGDTFLVLTKRPGRMLAFARWRANSLDTQRSLPECRFPRRALALPSEDDWSSYRSVFYGSWWPRNVWAGTSLEADYEGGKRYTGRLDLLMRVPAPVRFVSVEPLLGSVDLRPYLPCYACGMVRGHDQGACRGGSCWAQVPYERRPWPTEFCFHERYSVEEEGWHPDGTECMYCWGRLGPRLDWVITGGESGPNARPMDGTALRRVRDQVLESGAAYFHKQNGGRWPTELGDEIDGQSYKQWPA